MNEAESRELPTNPDASKKPGSIPPPAGAEYFDRAYRKLVEVHEQQIVHFRELHDEGGSLGRLHAQMDLVLHEVRSMRRDWGTQNERILKLEERADDHDRRLRDLEGSRHAITEPAPPPA